MRKEKMNNQSNDCLKTRTMNEAMLSNRPSDFGKTRNKPKSEGGHRVFMEGHLISGEFYENRKEFSLQQVKHFVTETTLNENQLHTLSTYLNRHQDPDGQIVTLYDQMPIRLSAEEVKLLAEDLGQIQSRFFS